MCDPAVYVEEDGFVARSTLGSLPRVELKQHWEAPGQLPKERGCGWLAYGTDGLRMGVEFQETGPFTTATKDQQPLYQLGSVAEFFVQPDVSVKGEYWEVHVAPNNLLTDVFVTDRDAFTSGKETYESALAHASNTVHKAVVDGNKWSAEVIIPWSAFGLTAPPTRGTEWGYSICRYNYPDRRLDDPEYSSTSPHAQLGYHRVEEYRRLRFDGPGPKL
eukprot:TRINITY_DN19059_c0_g2_i1.p2 TRINITY_DN19059_c0_g2~~TRINITY_DN19059_c0_g2_i1.p2  ORF type:complete len:218 (+),score=71.98 TRINITY_DN19059_c0_g2_i1:52-705(+)